MKERKWEGGERGRGGNVKKGREEVEGEGMGRRGKRKGRRKGRKGKRKEWRE